MTNFLETILARKREEVNVRKKSVPVDRLKGWPAFSRTTRSLSAALAGKRPAIIAEIKKASPSRGILRHDFDYRQIARQYIGGGASALSVLTDKEFFQGDISYLEDLSTMVSIPLLRKDFIIESYQLYESKAYGADAVLLIAAALDRKQLSELHIEVKNLGMESVIEVHSERDIASLEGINTDVVGINNRDLATFETDLGTSARLRRLLPQGAAIVSESGISTPDDVKLLAKQNIHSVLIGELFMKSRDPGIALHEFLVEVQRT